MKFSKFKIIAGVALLTASLMGLGNLAQAGTHTSKGSPPSASELIG